MHGSMNIKVKLHSTTEKTDIPPCCPSYMINIAPTLSTCIFADHESKVYKFVKDCRYIFNIVQLTRSICSLTMMLAKRA